MSIQSMERQKQVLKDKGLEKVLKDIPCVIIAEGAASGHSHAFYAPDKVVFNQATGDLTIKEKTGLDHEEHKTQTFQPGTGAVDIQREYSRGMLRQVMD